MKDAAPRIFRSLETHRGRAEFDVIVTAAVSAYGSLRAPTERQSVEFGRLVTPLFERTRPETQRALAASLSHSSRVPADLVDLIVASPLEVAAPFLVSSPALSPLHLRRLAERGDERLDKILAGRLSRGLDADEAATPPAQRRASVEAPPLAPEHLAERPGRGPVVDAASAANAAAFVRDTLRQIARAGAGDSRTVGSALLRAARRGTTAFFDVVETRLSLSAAERARIEADESGLALASALKGAGVDTGQALAILMLACPRIGLDVKAFQSMAERYPTLDPEPTRRPAARQSDPADRASPDRDRDPAERTPLSPFGRRQPAPSPDRKSSNGR